MAVTRIKNNQITDATITYAKIANGTLTGALFNPNLTFNSNITINGNLTLTGSTDSISATNTYVNDPLVVFNNGFNGTPTYDIGILVNRNLTSLAPYGAVNAAWVWREADTAFEGLLTTETGTTTGSINNSGFANLKIGNITANSMTLTTGTFSASGGIVNTPISGSTGYFTTAQATNLSTGNILVTGGSTTGLTNFSATTAQATNFSSGNAQITGGSVTGLTTLGATTATLTDLSSTTSVATNFSSGNAQVTGGTIVGLTNLGATTAVATNLSTGNAQITGGSITGLTNFSATTLQATNFSSPNVVISGGYISGLSNVSAALGTLTNLGATTAVATNLSTGNAVISGGYISALANITATTANFGTATAATLNATAGNITTLYAGSVNSANAVITGGSIDSTPIGASTKSTGAFTTLTANDTVTFTKGTDATSTTTGALQVTGGVGVSGNVWIGGNLYVANVFSTTSSTLVIEDPLVYLQSPSVGTYNYDIGFYSDFIGGPASVYAHTGLARNYSTNQWGLFSNIKAEPTGTISWSDAGIIWDTLKTGDHIIANTTAASSTTTGALQVAGGAGIAGALYAGSIQGTPIGASSASTGAFTTITSSSTITASGNIVAASGTASTSQTTGALVVVGGIGASGNINVGATTSRHLIAGNLLVGAGTALASASTTLQVNQNVDNPLPSTSALHISALSGIAGKVTLDSFGNGSSAPSMYVARSSRGTSASPSASQSSDAVGAIVFRGYGATGYKINSAVTSAGMVAIATENFTDSAQGTQIEFSTIPKGSTTASTALRLFDSGNVSVVGLTESTAYNNGAFTVTGGAGIGKNLNVGGGINTTLGSTFGGVNTFYGNVMATSGVDTTAINNGALMVSGGLNVSGNAYVGNNLYIGPSAFSQVLTAPTIIAVDNGSSYAQIAMKNTNTGGSADFAAYADDGNDSAGWVDMGIAGSAFSDSNYTITKPHDGYLLVRPLSNVYGGNLVLSTSEVGTYNDIVLATGSFLAESEVARFHGNVSSSGNFTIKLPTNAAPAANVGAFQVWGGESISGNSYIGSAMTINGSQTAGNDFKVMGKNSTNLIWARPSATYDQVLVGNTITTGSLTGGAKFIVNSTDSMLLPTGTSAQRPSSTGFTDVTGMFRYNTTLGYIEFYNGTSWQGVSTQFTVITDEQFNGDGSTVGFTLAGTATTSGTLVSINGVIQIPTLAYSISDTTLTFTEAPASGDVIDVRRMTTTQSITSIASTNGFMQISTDNNGIYISTGSSSPAVTTLWDTSGAQISAIANVSVASANTATTIDTFAHGTYRTAKYLVQVTNGAKYQAMEALVVTDGTTATVVSYGIVQTNGNLGVLTATTSGSATLLQFVAANATNNVRIKKDYMLV